MHSIRPGFIEELNAGRRDGGFVGSVLPNAVTVVEGPVSAEADDLRPEEAAHVLNAVPKRRGEFATGRRFAHRALAILQAPPGPLLVNEDRSPRWPPGVTGCISHTDRYCAVAAAPATEFARDRDRRGRRHAVRSRPSSATAIVLPRQRPSDTAED